MDKVYHPLLQKNLTIYKRGLADEAQRRSFLRSSPATASYPIPESYEHRSQLGDLSIFQSKPVITMRDTIKAAADYQTFLKSRESSRYLQNEFARVNFGLTGNINCAGLDVDCVYPPMMHRVFNALSSLCLRVDYVVSVLLKKKNKWLQNITTVAQKVDEEKRCIKFDEVGVKAFFESFEKVLKSSPGSHFRNLVYFL